MSAFSAAAIKQQLRQLLDLPTLGPIALHDPQQDIQVWLRGAGDPINVTNNNVIAALRPLTIGVMFNRDYSPELRGYWLRLCMHESHGQKCLLGAIHLRLTTSLSVSEHRLCLFEACGYENHCRPALVMRLNYLRSKHRATIIQRANPYNFQVRETDLRCCDVFYICPRPVVLVTVGHEGVGNMFPMDLIGPTDSPWFTMALRNTSSAVKLMQESKRMALASVPWNNKDVAYELGKYHKLPSIDWATLPMRTTRSPLFGLPVLEGALKVQEVRVRQFHQIGSHVVFITSTGRETVARHVGLQLFHRFGAVSDFAYCHP